MNDSSPQESKPSPFGPPTGGTAPSPFDSPTEEFPDSPNFRGGVSTPSTPRTNEELDGRTELLPTYGKAETQPTYSFASIPASTTVPGEPPTSRRARRYDNGYGRGTTDLGLLLLRLVLGGTFIGTGLMKLAGWWHGDGIQGTRHAMEHMGWKQPTVTGALVTAGELGGGALVVLGLLTPLAAGALLAVMIDAWLTLQHTQHGLTYNVPNHPSIPLTVVLGVVAAALILTGPGRVSLDTGRGWATRPRAGSFLVFLAAVVAAVLVWIFLHGGNPLPGFL